MKIPENPNVGTNQSTAHYASGSGKIQPTTLSPPVKQVSSATTSLAHARKQRPGWLSTKVVDNDYVTHCPAAASWSNPLPIAAGQAYNFKASDSFHEFFEHHIKNAQNRPNPTAPLSWFFGTIPVIAVLDERDLAALLPHAMELSQGPHNGLNPLGPIGELLTPLNLLLQDKFEKNPTTGNPQKNKEYVRQIRLINRFTLRKEYLNKFARTTMSNLINSGLKKASESANGVELMELASNLAVKNGLMLILGFKEDDYYVKHREFLDQFLGNVTDPKLAFNRAKLYEILKNSRKQAIELMLQLIEDNYKELLEKPDNLVVKGWASLFQDDPENFPQSFDAFKEPLTSGTNEEKEVLERLLFDLVFVAIVASETTAQAICFAIYELFNSPDWRERIRKEIADNLQNGITLEEMDRNTMKHFPMLSAFVMEGLDLHSPVPITSYIAKEDIDVFLSDGSNKPTTIVAGTIIVKHLQQANRASLSDGETFDPLRYLRPTAETGAANEKSMQTRQKINLNEIPYDDALNNLARDQQQNFHTFSDTTRPCPGRFFSSLEIGKTVGIMVRDFDLSATDRETGEVLASVSLKSSTRSTLHLKQQIDVRLKPREQ